MAHQTTRILKQILLFTGMAIALNACYYDNVEDLYPQSAPCDTTNITYSGVVFPIINSNCTGCHSGSAPAGNVKLENYNDIVSSVNSGALMGAIRHESNWSPMPKNGAKLDDCTISKLEIWIDDGMPNN